MLKFLQFSDIDSTKNNQSFSHHGKLNTVLPLWPFSSCRCNFRTFILGDYCFPHIPNYRNQDMVLCTVLHRWSLWVISLQCQHTRFWNSFSIINTKSFDTLVETVGFAARAVNAHQTPNWTLVIFVIQSMGILLAPALLAASIYMEFGLLVDLTEGEKYSIVRRSLITKIFVTGDVLSFLFQAIGEGYSRYTNYNMLILYLN